MVSHWLQQKVFYNSSLNGDYVRLVVDEMEVEEWAQRANVGQLGVGLNDGLRI